MRSPLAAGLCLREIPQLSRGGRVPLEGHVQGFGLRLDRLGRAVQLLDAGDDDLGNEACGLVALRGQLVVAYCACNLHMGALSERLRGTCPSSPHDAAMPGRVPDVFAGLAIL